MTDFESSTSAVYSTACGKEEFRVVKKKKKTQSCFNCIHTHICTRTTAVLLHIAVYNHSTRLVGGLIAKRFDFVLVLLHLISSYTSAVFFTEKHSSTRWCAASYIFIRPSSVDGTYYGTYFTAHVHAHNQRTTHLPVLYQLVLYEVHTNIEEQENLQ